MKPSNFIASFAALALVGSAPANAAPRSRPALPVVVYEGTVDSKSASRLMALAFRSVDKIIGLKLTVVRSRESEERYYTGVDGDQLNITSGDPLDAPIELLINGGIGTTMDMLTVDGFYLVKSGGMHAGGAVSYGAESVSEATLRMNPAVKIAKRHL